GGSPGGRVLRPGPFRRDGGAVSRYSPSRVDTKKVKLAGLDCPSRLKNVRDWLLLVGVGEKFLGADNLAVQGAGDERLAFHFAGLGVGDSHSVDLQCAPYRALVVGSRFDQVGECTKLRALSGDKIALRQDDLVDRGRTELIFVLLGFKRLLLKFACLTSGFHTRAVLFQSDVGVAHVEQSRVFQLLHLCFELPLDEHGTLVIRLQGAIANGDGDAYADRIVRVVIVKHGAHGVAEALLVYACYCRLRGGKQTRHR